VREWLSVPCCACMPARMQTSEPRARSPRHACRSHAQAQHRQFDTWGVRAPGPLDGRTPVPRRLVWCAEGWRGWKSRVSAPPPPFCCDQQAVYCRRIFHPAHPAHPAHQNNCTACSSSASAAEARPGFSRARCQARSDESSVTTTYHWRAVGHHRQLFCFASSRARRPSPG